jgi:hypothetical protein
VTSRVSSRQSTWPPRIVTAIDARDPAPAPLPNAIGIIPATIAMVVIRIGRSRTWFGLNQRLVPLDALLAQRVGVVDLQDRVLLDDAEQHHQADRAVDVDRHAERHQRQQAAGRLRGSDVMIVSGWMKLLNCDASTM